MDTERIVDYFVQAGIPLAGAEPLVDVSQEAMPHLVHQKDPIVELAVINRTLGEEPPPGFTCIEGTPYGLPADLNHGSLRAPEMYLCLRRGTDLPPLTDIGVLYEGREKVRKGCEVLMTTVGGRVANVNNTNSMRIFITMQRAPHTTGLNMLVVTDICVIVTSKGEMPPHAFLQIGKGLNQGMLGSDVYLCYKKSALKGSSIVYKPGLISRYPLVDHEDFPLPNDVATFCLPLGASLECCSPLARLPDPSFYTFVLTLEGGTNVYGAALKFYEEVAEEQLTLHQKADLAMVDDGVARRAYQSKSICLLSRWSFFDTFQKFLTYLYRLSITGPHLLPIERYIYYFMNEVPFPTGSRVHVQLSADEDVLLSLPEETPLPQNGASFVRLLRNLSPENCVFLLLHTLLEHKVVIHSLRPDVLTGVAEAVRTMIFPFHWQCPYVPLCPLSLSYVLNAPCPFIVGIDTRYFDLYEPPSGVVFVDLDTNSICASQEMEAALTKTIPKKAAQALKVALQKIVDRLAKDVMELTSQGRVNALSIEADIARQKKRASLELATQEAFLVFMAVILKGYSSYLKPIMRAPTAQTTDLSSLFDSEGFLRSRDKSYQKFFQIMTKTQMFARFIEERSFVSEKESGLAVFDECIKQLDENKPWERRLFEHESSSSNSKTIFIMPPDAAGLMDGVQYSYRGFPPLKPELFVGNKPDNGHVKTTRTPLVAASPMTRRTKHELRVAQRTLLKDLNNPELWAKCLLWHTYSLWFIHLPAYVVTMKSKSSTLRSAYDVLVKMHSTALLQPLDEVCYRVLMQLYSQYHQPALAVHVLSKMKALGIQPNAVTYGLYNKAVLESAWHSAENKAILYWTKLRNVVAAVGVFKKILYDIRRSRATALYAYHGAEYDVVNRGGSNGYHDYSLAGYMGYGLEPTTVVNTNHYYHLYHDEQEDNVEVVPPPPVAAGRIAVGDTNGHDVQVMISHKEQPVPMLTLPQIDLKCTDESQQQSTDGQKQQRSPGMILKRRDQSLEDWSKTRRSAESTCSTGSTITGVDLDLSASPNDKTSELCSQQTEAAGSNIDSVDSAQSSDAPLTILVTESETQANEDATSSSKDFPVSPERGQRAPVTDNDPLGLFAASPTTSTSSSVTVPATNLLISGQLLGMSSLPQVPFGSASSLSLSASSSRERITAHVPHSHTVAGVAGEGTTMYSSNDSLLSTTDQGSASPAIGTPKSSRWKPASWRTEKLGSALKFAASAVGTKLQRGWQQTVGTGNVNGSGDDDSRLQQQQQPFLPSEAGTPQRQQQQQRASGGQLPLDGSAGRKSSLDDMLTNGRATAKPLINRNVALVSGFLSGIAQSSTFQGFSNKWESMKGALKESLVESMALSDDDQSSIGSAEQFSGGMHGAQLSEFDEVDLNNRSLNSSWPGYGGGYGWDGNPQLPQQGVAERNDRRTSAQGSVTDGGSVLSLPVSTHNIGLDVEICSQSTCGSCSSLLYDEDIMGGWSAEDSNLNTSCVYCGTKVLPHLHIYIKDLRHLTKPFSVSPSQSVDSVLGAQVAAVARAATTIHRQTSATSGVSSNAPTATDSNAPTTPPHDRLSIDSGTVMTNGCADSSESPTRTEDKEMHVAQSNDSVSDGSPVEPVVEPMMSNDPTTTEDLGLASNNCNEQVLANDTKIREELTVDTTVITTNGDVDTVASVKDGAGLGQLSALSISDTSLTCQLDDQVPVPPVNEEPLVTSLSPDSKATCIMLAPVSVPYLSPLVLRKELETIISCEGDHCLNQSQFIDEHPIVYWNLVYCFRRLDLPSHLPGLLLVAKATANCNEEVQKTWSATADSRHVCVRPVWDNMRLQEELGRPMYILWGLVTNGQLDEDADADFSKITDSRELIYASLMEKVIECIKANDALTPINLLLNARQEVEQRLQMNAHGHSMYRDILNLIFVVLGRDQIDHDSYDREYITAYSALSKAALSRMLPSDRPPPPRAQLCRKVFPDLPLY